MHKRLQKQLNKLQIDPDLTDVDVKKLHKLIQSISKTYDKYDRLISKVEAQQNVSNTEIHSHYMLKEKENKRHFHALLSSIPDLMYLLDKNGYHLEVYAEGKEHLLVRPKKELLYKPCF